MKDINLYINESLYGYEHTAIEAYKFMNEICSMIKEHKIPEKDMNNNEYPYYEDERVRMSKELPKGAPITRSRTLTIEWVNGDENKSVLQIGQVLNKGYKKMVIIKYTSKDQICSVSNDIESQWDLQDNWRAYRCTENVKDAIKNLIEKIEL